MKKHLFLFFTTLFILSSCSNDVSETNNLDVSVSGMIRKNYNTTTGGILNTTNYEIVDNKIESTTSTNSQTTDVSSSVFNYSGNRLSNIVNSQNSVVNAQYHYVYDTNDKLVEYRSEAINPSGQITSINKHTFTHTSDTIYSQWTRSLDAVTFSLISNAKIVLDSNGNQTFIEVFDNLNNETDQIIKTYDSNNNIVKEDFYTLDQNGTPINTLTNTIDYSTSKNTLYYIMEKTYGKDVLMLLYPYAGSAINNIDVKSYSPNSISTFNTTFEGDLTFSITNLANENSFSEFDEFKTFVSSAIFGKFTYEYYFN